MSVAVYDVHMATDISTELRWSYIGYIGDNLKIHRIEATDGIRRSGCGRSFHPEQVFGVSDDTPVTCKRCAR